MNALEKLSAVVIKADARITVADQSFCKAHQSAYEAAKEALVQLGTVYSEIINQQDELLTTDSVKYDGQYIRFDELTEASINKRIENLHGAFINRIVRYFNDTYHVSISAHQIQENLLPKEPSSRWGVDFAAEKQYVEEMCELTLRYEDILDLMFIQLGGRNFSERALDEIKAACHKAAWSSYDASRNFEVKGATIQFTFWACSCDSFGNSNYWELTQKMKDIIRGVAHFETGTFYSYPDNIKWMLDRSHREVHYFEFTSCQKITQLKMFKNHRVDLKFASKELAREFADEYLGTVC